MKKRHKCVLILFLVCSMLFSLFPEGMAIRSASASISDDIHFTNPTIPNNYEEAGYVVAMDNFELWHHSGGYWSNETLGIQIKDSEIVQLSNDDIMKVYVKLDESWIEGVTPNMYNSCPNLLDWT